MIKRLFTKTIPGRDPRKKYDVSDFSDFFIHAPAAEQKKVIRRAVIAANKEQRELTMKSTALRSGNH